MSSNFREELKVEFNTQKEQIGKEIDAYRTYVNMSLAGYIKFMELINNIITDLQKNKAIGNIKLIGRLKAVGSALVNTRKKVLDDIFGFEIIAENERDKEILMLIIHNLFVEKRVRHKNHNKSNGYVAHHCTGTVKSSLKGDEISGIEKHILGATTYELKEQFRDLPKHKQRMYDKDELYDEIARYPTLKQEILQNGGIDKKLQKSFEKVLVYADSYFNEIPRKKMPIVEVQFKTTAVEQEIKSGRAQHSKYKKVNENDIKKRFVERSLVRGVDFPFVFARNNKGELALDSTIQTIIKVWPFLEDTIRKYIETYEKPAMTYDLFFAKVFPELEPYIKQHEKAERCLPADSFCPESSWNLIKNKIVNNTFILPQQREIRVGRKS